MGIVCVCAISLVQPPGGVCDNSPHSSAHPIETKCGMLGTASSVQVKSYLTICSRKPQRMYAPY